MSVSLISMLGPAIIPILVPVLVAAFKTKVYPKIPSWATPLLAVITGPIIDFLLAAVTARAADPKFGVLYGLAGIGIREVLDQTRKNI